MPTPGFYEQLDARLSASELAAVSEVRSFAREVIAPLADGALPGTTMPREVIHQWAQLGMTGLQTPRSLGGMEASFYAKIRAAQEIARVSFACAFSLNNIQGFVTRIAQYGTASQRQRYMARLLSGHAVGAYAITEPGAGSDVLALATTARKVEGGWLLSGEKSWITNGQIVDVILVLAQTSSGARGLGGFLVDMSLPGLTRVQGQAAGVGTLLSSGGVLMHDCLVSDENLIHPPGEAFGVAMKAIHAARIHVAAMCVAMLESALSQAVSYCAKRSVFGQPLLSHQGLRWQLSSVATDVEAAHQLVIRGAELVETGEDTTLIAAHAKRFSVDAACRGLLTCIQVMGAEGVLDKHGLMRQLGEAKLAGYADGTTETMTERIGQLLEQRYQPASWEPTLHNSRPTQGSPIMFEAIYLTQGSERKTDAVVKQLDVSDLPEGDVLVSVEYSTVNYKDALAITGRSPVVRKFPMVPGIDFAGVVEESSNPLWKAGDRVVLNGFGVGEGHWGGLAGKARVKAEWLVRLPETMSASSAMAIGTAGYTAMLCVMALERHDIAPESGPILVTGANGGVGSIAVALLSKLGYEVAAATGRPQEAERLKELGARQIVERNALNSPGKPLQKEQWAAAIDSVGSHTLANVCAGLRYGGTVAACGLAQGMDLPSSVAPFILRGVTLAGVDSVNAPMARRVQAWSRLAELLSSDVLSSNTQTISLADAITIAPRLLDGAVRGRVLVDVAR